MLRFEMINNREGLKLRNYGNREIRARGKGGQVMYPREDALNPPLGR